MKGKIVVGIILMASTWSPCASAGERLFTYSYESDTLPKGGLEFEHWTTYSNAKSSGNFTSWDFRDELEYGIAPDLQTSLYLNYQHVFERGREDRNGDGVTDSGDIQDEWLFQGVSSEWIYNILTPYADPIGLAVYAEGTAGPDKQELEEKLLLQKNFFDDKLITVLNAAVEEEWEEHATAAEGGFELTMGAAYKICPKFSLGFEARNKRAFPENFQFEEFSTWSVGPNAHYGDERWFATLTWLAQIAGRPETQNGLELEHNTRNEVRLIAGVTF